MSDEPTLFNQNPARQRERLRAAGWVEVEKWGRKYWTHPTTHAYFVEAEAVATLPPDDPPDPAA